MERNRNKLCFRFFLSRFSLSLVSFVIGKDAFLDTLNISVTIRDKCDFRLGLFFRSSVKS